MLWWSAGCFQPQAPACPAIARGLTRRSAPQDRRRGNVFVADIVEGTNAERFCRVAQLNQNAEVPQKGDVLRGCTSTNIVYKNFAALSFGSVKPQRTIVMYGADEQAWPNVMLALSKGVVADGDVTLVFERAAPSEAQSEA